MVKRAKLTLDHTEDEKATVASSQTNKTETKGEKSQSVIQGRPIQLSNFGKLLLVTGLTLVTLVILKRKVF